MGELAKESRDEPWRADSAVEALVARRVAARRAGDFALVRLAVGAPHRAMRCCAVVSCRVT